MDYRFQKRFVIVAVVTMLSALAFIAAFNILVDPTGTYRKLHLTLFEPLRYLEHDRVSKGEMARRGDWEIIILGSSRAKAGIPAEHPFLFTNRTCNLSVDAARFSELAMIFDYTESKNQLKHVLLCIDYYMFSKGPTWLLDFPESRFNPELNRFVYHCRRLFSQDSLLQSWETVKLMTKDFRPEPQSRLGFYETRVPDGISQRELFDRTLRQMGAGYTLQGWDMRQMEYLRGVVRSCRESGIDLRIAILPVHALDLELLYEDGKWPKFESWKCALVGMIAEEGVEGKTGLWDFTGYAGPPAEPVPPAGDVHSRMKYYFENSHFTPLLGWQIVDVLCGEVSTNRFGKKLTSEGVGAHLSDILKDRAEFAKTNAADIAWVKRIMSEVAKKPMQLGAR